MLTGSSPAGAPGRGGMLFGSGRDRFLGIGVALLAVVVYANTLGNGFVWDDEVVIVANAALRGKALALFGGIDTARSTDPTPYYRPLSLLTFLLEERIHGLTPHLVRAVSLVLHSINVFLAYRMAGVVSGVPAVALLTGLLCAVHPLHTEAVDLNAARNTLLATLFVLAAFLAHARAVRSGRYAVAVAGALLFLAGLLSKEPALGVLVFIVFLEVRRLRRAGRSGWRAALWRLLPYAIATLVYLFLRRHALAAAGVQLDILSGLGMRLADNIYIIPRYLLTVLWPAALSPIYFVPEDFHPLALPLSLAWFCLIAGLAWCATRGRSSVTLFGLSWLLIFWLPVSGLVPITSAPLADRYLYLPAIGLWLTVADQFIRFAPLGARGRMVTVAVILAALAMVTVRRNSDWRSDVALFSRVVELYPERAYGHHNLGCAYLDKERNMELAERSFERALALDPAFPRLQTQLGYIRLQQGDYAGALRFYEGALQCNPLDAEAWLNRGMALEKMGRYDEATAAFQRFLMTPGNELPEARRSIPARISELAGRHDAPGGTKR